MRFGLKDLEYLSAILNFIKHEYPNNDPNFIEMLKILERYYPNLPEILTNKDIKIDSEWIIYKILKREFDLTVNDLMDIYHEIKMHLLKYIAKHLIDYHSRLFNQKGLEVYKNLIKILKSEGAVKKFVDRKKGIVVIRKDFLNKYGYQT